MISGASEKINGFLIRKIREIDAAPRSWLHTVAREFLRLLYVAAREVEDGHLTLRAMSLVYTTLLSIVPLFAISLSVLKAFGVHHEFIEPFLLNFLSPLGSKGEEITARIIGFVENIKAGVLGSFGLVMLIYTVFSVIHKVENAFNTIWRIHKSRSLVRRFSNYMSVMLIGPVLLFSAVGLTATFMSHTMVQRIISFEPLGTILRIAGTITPFIIVCIAFTFFYLFIPNIKVRVTSALTGGILAGLLWEATGWAFAFFFMKSGQYAAIYSGFAILILFMIWLYLNWLILLLGAQVSFYHQNPNFLSADNEAVQPGNRLRERIAFLIMYFIGSHYYNNKPPWTLHSLSGRIGLPSEPVDDVLVLLKKNSLVLETADDPPAYLPAKDIETIPLQEILDAVRGADSGTSPLEIQAASVAEVDRVIKSLDDAISGQLGRKTLKDIVLSVE
ncbi:MAG TPA: ribonuclease BN [Nitrospiraceae bacterium]|nr:ribonuclease BN [Nitrospiraceae bacterium]